MPTVPVIDQTASAAPQDAVSGSASAPGQGNAPGQTPQQTDALGMRAGQTIGNVLAEQVDDATTKAAETAALGAAHNVLYDPQNGYFSQQGQNAVEQFQPAQQAVVKAFQDQLDGLSNDTQKAMFQQVMQQHLLTYGQQMSNYNRDQTVTWATNESHARSDNYAQLATYTYPDWQRSDGDFAKNKTLATSEALHAAALTGAPPDSPTAKALVQQRTTQIAQGVLARMMDNGQYDEAKVYYDKALAGGEIDDRAAEQLGNAVTEGHVSNTGKNLANEATQVALGAPDGAQQRIQPVPGGSVTSVIGAPRTDGSASDGITISVPVGTQVQAPADGKVTSVSKDDPSSGGLSMEITYPNGNVEKFANLSAANYQPGQSVTQGAVVALTGKSGDATGPALQWAMTDKDGNPIDPRAASPVPKNPADFTDPDALQKAIDYVNGSDQTDQVKSAAISNLRSQHGQATEMANQKYQQVKQQVTDFYLNHNESIDGLPSALRMQLKPQDLQDFVQPPEKKTDLNTWYGLVTDPEKLTVSNVQSAYVKGELNSADFKALTARATAQQNDPASVQNATNAIHLVNFYAQQSYMETDPEQQSDQDKFSLGTLTYRVLQRADQEQADNKGKVSTGQMDSIIKDELIKQTLAELHSPESPAEMSQGQGAQPSEPRSSSAAPGNSAPTQQKNSIGPITGYPETGKNAWRAANDAVFINAANKYNEAQHLSPGDSRYVTPKQLKAQAMVESGGNRTAFETDPLQVNNPLDWTDKKAPVAGLKPGEKMTPAKSAEAALLWQGFKGEIHDGKGKVASYKSRYNTLRDYNGSPTVRRDTGEQQKDYYARTVIDLSK